MSQLPNLKNDLLTRHIARTDLITCSPQSSAEQAIRLMAKHRIGSIIVCDKNLPIGIVTRADVISLVQQDRDISTTELQHFMSSPVTTIDYDVPIDEASALLVEQQLRHLVVVDEFGILFGILSENDVVNSQGMEYDLFLRTVADVANKTPLKLSLDLTLKDAIKALQNSKQSALLVTRQEQAFGILTAKDVIAMLARGLIDTRLGDCCSNSLIAVRQNSSLYSARKIFRQHGFHHLAVKDASGAITGLLSYNDILRSAELDYVRQLRELLEERDQALELSLHNLKLAQQVIDTSMEAIVITDKHARIQRVNPAFTEITGYKRSDVLGRNPNILSSGRHNAEFYTTMWHSLIQNDFWQGEIWNKRKDGTIFPEWLSITAIKDDNGDISQYASIFSDLTEIKKSEARIKRLAYFDELTRLPNRKLFNDRLHLALSYAKEHDHQVALAYIDLDYFQRINDLYGHDTGDQVLQEIGRRIEEQMDEGDTVARFGGDEFNLILTDINGNQAISALLSRLQNAVNQPILIKGVQIKATISIGVSFFPGDADNAEELLQCADSAVHQAKDFGRDSFRFFSSEQHRQIQSRYQMGNDLQQALVNNEFELYYQPKVCAHTRLTQGAEALLRWKHPTLGFVSPAEFIPLAEDIGLIEKIGNFVLYEATRQGAEWFRQGIELPIAINVSAKQMLDRNIAHRIINQLKNEGLPLHLFSIELTETSFLHCLEETQATISTLRAAGIEVAIDDFGTGYSSLSYIRNMALDVLKIDRSFLINIDNSDVDRKIVASIIQMSQVMGLKVVAEGIETEVQFELLRELNCDLIQGYLMARPMPAAEFHDWHLGQQG
ncbi:EAL domain-containing protein [Amphritea sp. HPY]|uniref:EAL domain-containing protein n=1 Tax=Amphritea sp. HPY TaxID=3421652 RepID=UPI003D7DA6A0